MGFLDRQLKKFKFQAKVPELHKYIGRTVFIPAVLDQPEIGIVVIADVRGNIGMTLRNHPMAVFYEINGKYLMNILRFHAQMEGDKSITEQQFQDFEDMELSSTQNPEKKIMGQT